MPTKPRKGGRTMPVGKTSSAGRTASGKAAKLRLGAASDETRAVARAGMPTATHLTRDNDDKDVNVATAIERGLAMATALGNNRIIGGPAPTGKTSSASKEAPGKAAKLRIGAVSDGTRAVARAGMPTGVHLTMDDDDEDVDVATASERGLAMRTALGNDRIIGSRVGANDRPETREVAVAGMPTGVPLTMGDDDEYVVNATAAEMVRPRSIAVATARGPATATGGSAPTGEYLPALLGLAAEENSQGKTGQCGIAANFLPAQERQHKKEADIAHGVRGGTLGDSMAPGGNEEDNFDDTPEPLPHGMADLRAAMAVEGTAAFRFADVTDVSDIADDWADDYGAFVANLYDEADVVAMALSPAARSQAYLAMLPNADTFVVLHGLHRWVTVPPLRSVNEGKLVAFEGETLGEDGREPPDLLRFDGEENNLFTPLSLSKIDLTQVTSYYDGSFPHHDDKWFDVATLDKIEGVRLGRLIPIPTAWAAMFLDYPNVGTALRRVQALISSVAIKKLENFRLLAYSMAYASFLLPNSTNSTSVLELDWKRLHHVNRNRMWRFEAWQAGDRASSETEFNDDQSAAEREALPVTADPFFATFGGDRRPRIIFPGGHHHQGPSWGGSPYGAQVQPSLGHQSVHPEAMPSTHPTAEPTNAKEGGPSARGRPTSQHGQEGPYQGLDIAVFMATVLKAQTDNQLAIAAASHTNMVAFHTATAQANAVRGGKDARMTVAKTNILRACTGQVLPGSF